MPTLTQKQMEEYVESGGHNCPHCGAQDGVDGESLTGSSVDIDGPLAWQDMTCGRCGNSWRDCYKLIGILPLE